jgi:hypothetical protein
MSSDGLGDQPRQVGEPPSRPGEQPAQPGPYGQAQPGWQAPYGQPGPYVQVGAGWPQLAGRRTNPLAIAALCCGIGQVIAGPFAGIAAIVLGAMSLRQIRESGEDGHGMAVTGLVLGIVGIVLTVLLVVFAFAVIQHVTSNS